MSVVWGIDTATVVSSTFLTCIENNYGTPSYIGHYLKTVAGYSDGLNYDGVDEIKTIHDAGISILLIWNSFDGAEVNSYSLGESAAKAAIDYAYSTFGIPSGKVIFADLEESYPVTANWIEGWVDTFFSYNPSGAPSPYYAPGFYANPSAGDFPASFCSAAKNDSNVPLAYIWANDATLGVTTKANAPSSVSPTNSLTCSALIVGWQYGTGGTACSSTSGGGPIDTDVWNPNYTSVFW